MGDFSSSVLCFRAISGSIRTGGCSIQPTRPSSVLAADLSDTLVSSRLCFQPSVSDLIISIFDIERIQYAELGDVSQILRGSCRRRMSQRRRENVLNLLPQISASSARVRNRYINTNPCTENPQWVRALGALHHVSLHDDVGKTRLCHHLTNLDRPFGGIKKSTSILNPLKPK